MNKWVVRAGGVVVGLGALVALWLVGGSAAAEQAEATARQAWIDIGLNLGTFASTHPRVPISASARALATAALPLGIQLRDEETVETPLARAQEAALAGDLPLGAVEDTLPALTPQATAYLSEHAVPIDRVRGLLLGMDPAVDPGAAIRQAPAPADVPVAGDPVVWETDIARTFSAPVPRFAGIRRLHQVLVMDAIARLQAGDEAAARGSLDAAWALGGSLRGRPDLTSQILAAALDRLTLAGLRRVPSMRAWSPALDIDHRAALTWALAGDAYTFLEWVASGRAEQIRMTTNGALEVAPTIFQRRVAYPLQKPWLRLSAADYATRLAGIVGDLKKQDLCTLDTQAFDASLVDRFPGWNEIGRIAIPAVARMLRAAARTDAEAELGRKVAEVRAHAAGGTWSAVLDSKSAVCPGVVWRTTVDATSATVAAVPDVLADPDRPLRFRMAMTPPPASTPPAK